MEKLIVKQNQDLRANLDGVYGAPALLENVVEVLARLTEVAGVFIIPLDGTMSALDFLALLDAGIPSTDQYKQLHFVSDFNRDFRVLSDRVKDMIVERENATIAGIQLTPTGMKALLQIDEAIIRNVLTSKRSLDSFRYQLPREQIFWEYLSIEGGKVKTKANAEKEITNRLTVYASDAQTKYYQEVSALLSKLSALEKIHSAAGLTLKSVTQGKDGYVFEPSQLTFISNGKGN